MARESAAERIARLEARGDELGGLAVAAGTQHPVHVATVEVLSDLMNMGSSLSGGGHVPQHLRVLMLMLDKGRPMMLDGISGLEPAAIQQFMAELVAKIQRICDVPIGEAAADGSTSAAGAVATREDLAPPA